MNSDKKKLSKTIDLFEKKNISYIVFYIILSAVVVSFIQGLYIFISQIFMVRFIPENKYFSSSSIFPNLTVDKNIIETMIRNVIALCAPFVIIGYALALCFGLGTSINYSRALGSQKYEYAKDIYSSGFYTSIISSIITSAIIILIANFIIPAQVGNGNGYPDPMVRKIYQETVIKFAKSFVFIVIAGNIFQSLMQLIGTLLNSEGRNINVTLIIFFTVLLSIVIVYLLIKFTSLGVKSAAIGNVTMWVSSIILLYFYTWYLSKKNQTLLNFSILKNLKIKWFVFSLIICVGATSLFRNLSSALVSIINNNEIINVSKNLHFDNINYITSINGATVPIFNLLSAGIVGVVRGGRSIISYLYSAKYYKKVKQAFLISNIMTISLALFFYIFTSFLFEKQLLSLFGIFDDGTKIMNRNYYADSVNCLRINSLTIVSFALSINGTLFFQAAGYPWKANFLSIMQAIFIAIPIIFINSAISKSLYEQELLSQWGSALYFYSSRLIAFTIGGIGILIYSFIWIYKKIPNVIILHWRN
ncbi:MAG: MATE family efflux transporter [Mycoplasmoidaceae bacterium]